MNTKQKISFLILFLTASLSSFAMNSSTNISNQKPDFSQLYRAMRRLDFSTVDYLLEKFSPVINNKDNSDMCPLLYAMNIASLDMHVALEWTKILVEEFKADINIYDKDGVSLFEMAAKKYDLSLLAYLEEKLIQQNQEKFDCIQKLSSITENYAFLSNQNLPHILNFIHSSVTNNYISKIKSAEYRMLGEIMLEAAGDLKFILNDMGYELTYDPAQDYRKN